MKKSIIALMMALVLMLCSSAMATETTFAYTAEEYMAGYAQFCTEALQKEIVWAEPVDTEDGLTGWAGTTEGMTDAYVYTVQGDTVCCGVATEMSVGLTDSDLSAQSTAFGMTVAAIPYASRYIELGNDIVALAEEMEGIEEACMTLVQNVFSTDAITAAMTEPYTETAEIAGHNAQLTLTVDIESMTMTTTFVFVP